MGNFLSTNLVGYLPASVSKFFDLPEGSLIDRIKKDILLRDICSYEIACFIYRVREEKLWRKEEFSTRGIEYRSFREWSINETGVGSHTILYYCFAISKFNAMATPQNLILDAIGIGWGKLYRVLRVSESNDDLIFWLSSAKKLSEEDFLYELSMSEAYKKGVSEEVLAFEREKDKREKDKREKDKRERNKKKIERILADIKEEEINSEYFDE